MSELKPCPWCGHIGLDFQEGSTFRWLEASCAGCGATAGETRVQTVGEGHPSDWRKAAEAEAIIQWNTRATPLTQPSDELIRRAYLFIMKYGDAGNKEGLQLAFDLRNALAACQSADGTITPKVG
jgi:hypothetical protein